MVLGGSIPDLPSSSIVELVVVNFMRFALLCSLVAAWHSVDANDVINSFTPSSQSGFIFGKFAVNEQFESVDEANRGRFVSDEAWGLVMKLRSRADAIISTATTVATDDARLTVRSDTEVSCVPLRLVVDPKGTLLDRSDLRIMQDDCSLVLLTCQAGALLRQGSKFHIGVPCSGGRPDVAQIVALTKTLVGGVVMVEAGGTFLEA